MLQAIQWCNQLPEDIVFEVEASSNVVSLQARMRRGERGDRRTRHRLSSRRSAGRSCDSCATAYLRTAAKCLRALARSFNHGDTVTINGDDGAVVRDDARPRPAMLRTMTCLIIDEDDVVITRDMALMICTTVEAAAAAGGA